MSISFASFIISLFIANRLRGYAKIHHFQQLEKWYKYVLILSFTLLFGGILGAESDFIKLVCDIYLIGMISYSIQRIEFRELRMFFGAFIPFAIVTFFGHLTESISKDFFASSKGYFEVAFNLSIVWMLAILFSQNRQKKAAEKERIKRQHEDEVNRAIAIRKVELEGLVVERTAELTEQKEELEHALSELRATQSQLIQSEKMASLGELTAGIAHEIQNPLNFVNNFSELNRELLDEMQIEFDKGNTAEAKAIINDIKLNLEKINHHGKRADSIVKGMLLHSRASSGQKEPTDINALADEYLRLAYHGLRAKDKSFNATLKTDFDEKVGKINVVPQELGRVILNLLNNAFYAVTEKKKSNIKGYEPIVSISTKMEADKLVIAINDNGNGIPQSVLDKIFQPFFTTKPAGQGTGLGLSMCYEIITKGHGGELNVNTTEGDGSMFVINLPIKN